MTTPKKPATTQAADEQAKRTARAQSLRRQADALASGNAKKAPPSSPREFVQREMRKQRPSKPR